MKAVFGFNSIILLICGNCPNLCNLGGILKYILSIFRVKYLRMSLYKHYSFKTITTTDLISVTYHTTMHPFWSIRIDNAAAGNCCTLRSESKILGNKHFKTPLHWTMDLVALTIVLYEEWRLPTYVPMWVVPFFRPRLHHSIVCMYGMVDILFDEISTSNYLQIAIIFGVQTLNQ